MGTAGGAIIISIGAAIISLGSLVTTIIFAVRNERGKKADVLRDSRQRLLFELERLRLWHTANGDEPAYDAVARIRTVIAEKPTCVTDSGRASSATEDIEINVGLAMKLQTDASRLNSLNPEFNRKCVERWFEHKMAIEAACETIVESSSPAAPAS